MKQLFTIVWAFQKCGGSPTDIDAHVIDSMIFDSEEEAQRALAKIDKNLGSDICNFISAVQKREVFSSAAELEK